VRVTRRMNSRVSPEDGARCWIVRSFILEALVRGVIQHRYTFTVNGLLGFIHNFRDRVQDKSFNLTGAARFKWLLNSKKTMQSGSPSGAEFTPSFPFTPSSELYEWTNAGNSEWGYRRRFQIQPVTCYHLLAVKIKKKSYLLYHLIFQLFQS